MSEEFNFLVDGPKRSPRATLILAHGAGAPMDSDFMNTVALSMAKQKVQVIRFEFPYMAERRKSGSKKPPNTASVLESTWLDVVARTKTSKSVFIGGKSMGGRIASMVADQAKVEGVICLGYPFHPTGKPEKLRTEHLQKIKTPVLVIQGERDPFGNLAEVKAYKLARKVKVSWLADGDHSFKPRKSSGATMQENMDKATELMLGFIDKHSK